MFWPLTLFLNDIALGERIAGVTQLAGAKGSVIDHLADGVVAAEAWAGVLALGFDASSVSCAVGVDDALGPAPFVRVANVIWEALAGGSAV